MRHILVEELSDDSLRRILKQDTLPATTREILQAEVDRRVGGRMVSRL